MKNFLGMLAGFLALAASGATELEIASQPEGATVIIDGEDRGLTPMKLFDLEPGAHRLKFRLAGHLDEDRVVTLVDGRPAKESLLMEEEMGLLLLKSEPSGADISIDGVSIGVTPKFIGDLSASKVHQLTLTAAGYRPSVINVKFDGRLPILRTEKLVKDAGILEVASDPAGAEVTVNGIVRGKTPLVLDDVPKGRATVKISLAGYEEEIRELAVVAAEKQTLSLLMKSLPGTLIMTSIPEGARMYLNGEFRGISPCTIASLKPGRYEVRAEKNGYATMSREVTVRNGSSPREEFRLSNVMGRIEIRTSPSGAHIIFGNRQLGVTSTKDLSAEYSDPFVIENVLEGEQTVVVRRKGYADVILHPVVENSKTTQLKTRMKRVFTPDVRVVTGSGEVLGMLVGQTPDYVSLEVKLGVQKSIPRSDIRRIDFLEDAK